VKAFADFVEVGVDWPSAWERSGLGEPVEDWAMRAAAQREDPASGFALVSEWLEQEIECSISAFERWISPVATLVLGVCVGAIGVAFILSMVAIMESLL
jgi:type II secretory pathway component PulF